MWMMSMSTSPFLHHLPLHLHKYTLETTVIQEYLFPLELHALATIMEEIVLPTVSVLIVLVATTHVGAMERKSV